MKVATMKLKTFEAANAAALDAAYETWREAQGERQLVATDLTHDGTNIVLTVFYTE